MADPQTVNTGLAIPVRGSNVGVWDLPVNADFTALDGFFGGVQTISAASTPITLTVPAGFTAVPAGGPTQAQNAVLRFTGVLTTPVQVTLPMPGYMIIENLTTGAFVLSFRAIGSGQIIAVQQGGCRHIYNDGTNVRFVNLPDVGTYLDVAAIAVPAWITACTIPPYLNCDGTTFNAATYPFLNSFLGGNTLPDLRGVARYTLNQGTGRITTAGSGLDGNTLFASKFTQTYIIVVNNLPPYTPSGSVAGTIASLNINERSSSSAGSDITTAVSAGNSAGSNIGVTPVSASGTISGTLSGAAQGGLSAPFGVVGPGTISGITMIRAA